MHSVILLALVAAASASYGGPAVVTSHAVHHAHGYAQSSQHHSQGGYGTYNYGYAEPNAAKTESKGPDGVVRGSYAYTAPNGKVIKNNYIADAHGFRSNLAPTAPKDFAIPAAGYAPYAAGPAYAPGSAYGGYGPGPAYGGYGPKGGHAYKTYSSHPVGYKTYSYSKSYAAPAYGYGYGH